MPGMTYEYHDDALPDRFWAHVTIDPETDCWVWTGGIRTTARGHSYPVFCAQGLAGRGPLNAARVSRALLVGDIAVRGTDGEHIVVTCGTSLCVNPDHSSKRGRGRKLMTVGWCRAGIHRITSEEDTYVSNRNALECRRCRQASRERRKATLEAESAQEAESPTRPGGDRAHRT